MSDEIRQSLPTDPTDWRGPAGHVLSRDAVLAHVPDETTDPPTYRAVTVGDVLAMQAAEGRAMVQLGAQVREERAKRERAEAELREWEKHHCEKRITTRCPACGHQTLFIAVGGHLTCSWLKCPEPSPERAWKDTDLELEHVRGRAVTAEMRAEQAEDRAARWQLACGRMRTLVVRLDSLLSLLWYRPSMERDAALTTDVMEALGQARDVARDAALAQTGKAGAA